MTEIIAGQIYTARLYRSGQSSKGPWEIMTTAEGASKSDVTIFAHNIPCGVKEGMKFKVEQILSIRNGFRRDKTNQWKPNVSIDCVITPIESEFDNGLAGDVDVKWEEIAASGDDPWADIDQLPL